MRSRMEGQAEVKTLLELIRSCATDLPKDVEAALHQARDRESGAARKTLSAIIRNSGLARRRSVPICQDTGTPVFYVTCPPTADRKSIREGIVKAVRGATGSVPLRPNAADPLSGANSGDNTGVNTPPIHFKEWGRDCVRYELLLKGGGSENVTRLYTLPDARLSALRDIGGVERCVLDAVHKAQGNGCPPYVIGVGIGGMADSSIALAKRQLLRVIGDVNPDRELRAFERSMLVKINSLGIGPMGLGGKATALAVKAARQHRHPASYFVAVSFGCWAMRRGAIEVEP